MTTVAHPIRQRKSRAPSRRQVESAAIQLAARSHAFEQAALMLDPETDEARRLTWRAAIAKAAMNRLTTLFARLCKTAAQVSAFYRRLVDALKASRTPVLFTMNVQRSNSQAAEPVTDREPVTRKWPLRSTNSPLRWLVLHDNNARMFFREDGAIMFAQDMAAQGKWVTVTKIDRSVENAAPPEYVNFRGICGPILAPAEKARTRCE